MTKPRLVLPPNSMPWGRWYEEVTDNTIRSISHMEQDGDSAGSQFAGQADNMARQVAGIEAATITYSQIPSFSGSFAADFTGPYKNILSGVQTFSPPSAAAGSATSCVVTVTFHALASVGKVPNQPLLKVNGSQFTNIAHNVQRPVQVYTEGYYALQGSVPLTPGQIVNVEFGVRAEPFVASTFTVDNCQIWLAFYGRIN